MNPIQLNLPHGARVVINALYDTTDPACLTDDLLHVALRNDTHINVGWFPENSPLGAYEICVYQGEFENQLVSPIELRRASDVARRVEGLARLFAMPQFCRAASGHVDQQQGQGGISITACSDSQVSFADLCHA